VGRLTMAVAPLHAGTATPTGAGPGVRAMWWVACWLVALHGGTPAAAAPALDWRPETGHRWLALTVPQDGKTGFTRLSSSTTGLRFTNLLDNARSIVNRNLLSGAGVAAGDVDGDGWCDVFFCGLDSGNALYRNLGGWRFADITAEAGVAGRGWDTTAAVFADIDGDGDSDLLLNTLGHGVRVFANDGAARFQEVTEAAGVASSAGGMSLALADVDGDGDLDLYAVNYRTTTVMDQPKTTFRIQVVEGQPVVAFVNEVPATSPELTNRFSLSSSGEVLEWGEPDALYLNDGRGRFQPVSFTGGSFLDEDGRPLTEPPRDWGLSAQFHDVNGDGAPDLYVCNDLWSPDRFWINDGRGRLRAIARLAVRTTSTFSMGLDFGDLNRDGHVDLMIVDMLATAHRDRHTQVSTQRPIAWPIGLYDQRPQVWRNTLQLNRGDATFAEIGYYAGVEASNWSWAPVLLDVDLDGYEDILIPNGQLRDFQNVDMQNRIDAARAARPLTQADLVALVGLLPDFSTPSLVFRNRGNLTFEEVGRPWGFGDVGVSQGTALADLDSDGDLDVLVNKLNEEAGMYRNDSPAPRLAVRLRGRAGNRQGIGAKLVVSGGPVRQSQEVICGGRYLSGADPLRTFATGTLTNRLEVAVVWRSGQRSLVSDAQPNRLYELEEPVVEAAAGAPPSLAADPAGASPPWFTDVSDLLDHRHHEDPFDDFERQPLLPHRLSQLGPGVAWHDVDGDGWDDLTIASGRGGPLGVFLNDREGGFRAQTQELVNRPAPRDQTTVLGIGHTLFVGAANYEDGQTNGGCLRLFDFQRSVSGDSVLGQRSSAGPLALADVDGDGALDLFIGGRVVPGRYPEPADSLLLRNQGGRLGLRQRFEKVGLVSSAVFSDLDNDGRPELALACEWGPIRIFRNDGREFVEWDAPLEWPAPAALQAPVRLSGLTGWWTGLTAADLDGDGRLDLVAGNWGLNLKYRRDLSYAHPRLLYYGDLDEDGTVDLIEGYFNPALGHEVPERGYLAVRAALPFIQEHIESFEAYGTSTLAQIYGARLQRADRLEVRSLASMVFLNRGDHFVARELPAEAQFAPVFGICAGDLDGDGFEDLFLSQNFFATTLEYSRHDAGRGLWLRGDGCGGLQPVPGQESGLLVYGEQRGCALSDYNQDGRVDLVVTQNGAQTKLFRNTRARPGLRVRLHGPPGNPTAVGAVLRLRRGESFGPARELHAGSGYWSQDSPVQVLAMPEPATQLEVRWPGGRRTQVDLPPNAREITVDPSGGLVSHR